MSSFISVLYLALIGVTCLLLAFYAPKTDYYLKPVFMRSNGLLMAVGLILTGLICFIGSRFKAKLGALEGVLTKHTAKIFPAAVLLLFIAECVFVTSGFFYSDWDPAGVLDAVYKILHHDQMAVSTDYFSAHPNNLMIVWIYVTVLRIAGIFGTESVIALSVFQCIIFSITGVLVFCTVSRVLRSIGKGLPYITSWIAWIIYAVMVGMSPWLIITYSDQVGLVIPAAVLYISVRMHYRLPEEKTAVSEAANQSKVQKFVCDHAGWMLIGVLAAEGYAIKPQSVIVTIAVILIEAVHFFEKRKINPAPVVFAVAFIVVHLLISKGVYPSLGLTLDPDKAFGMPHYFMMGLNPETDGVYSNDDTNFTNGIPHDERTRKNMEVARERVHEYGAAGLAGHLARKTMINFGDGTFAWGIDGNFFAGTDFGNMPYVKSNGLTPHIMAWIQLGGEHNLFFSTMEQFAWLTILALSLMLGVSVFVKKKEEQEPHGEIDHFSSVILLSLVGLFIFELLFEAKARYLFTYVPFWIMAAVIGVSRIAMRYKSRP
ncbi:hypothetical protein SAMN06296386_103186 [Lachnospiraceae bacterium]|nr:hypothetical protein SAMN06296386_103186 [Lachnospiraceae bacterium]